MKCTGKVYGRDCGHEVLECTKCGRKGCDSKNCTNQNFEYGKCQKCGTYGYISAR